MPANGLSERDDIAQFVREQVNAAIDSALKDKLVIAVGNAIKEQIAPAIKDALSEFTQQLAQHPPTRAAAVVENADGSNDLPSPSMPQPQPQASDREQNERFSTCAFSDTRDAERARAPARSESRSSFVSFNNDLPQFLQEEKAPSFDKKLMSPPQYIEALKDYFRTQNIYSEMSKLACARFGLKKRYNTWFDIHSEKIDTFHDFEKCFISDLWSEGDQLAYKDEIFAEKFRSDKKEESLSEFFERNYSKAVKYFPMMSFAEIKLKFAAQVPGIINFDVLIANTSSYEKLKNKLKSFDRCKTVQNNYGSKNNAAVSKQNSSSHKDSRDNQNNSNRNDNTNYNKSNNYYRGNSRYQPYQQRNYQRLNGNRPREHGVYNIQQVSDAPHAQARNDYQQERRTFRGRGGPRRWNNYRRRDNSNGRNFDLASTVKNLVAESMKQVIQTAGATIGGTSNQTATKADSSEN